MYIGKVIESFVDKHTWGSHAKGTTYKSDDLERMRELAALGKIEFDDPGEQEPGAGQNTEEAKRPEDSEPEKRRSRKKE